MSGPAAAAASSILVFGATGDVGSRLVRLLASQSRVSVTAAVRSLDKAAAKLPSTVQAVAVDTASPQSIQQAVKDSRADATFLYAQTASTAALDALKAGGVRRVVLLSSCHAGLTASGLPPGALVHMHKQPEDDIRARGFTHTFLRADRFTSNMAAFVKPLNTGRVTLAFPDAQFYVVHPADVAAAAAEALTTDRFDNRSVSVIGPAALSDKQQLQIVARRLGRPVEVVQVSRAERAAQLAQHVPSPAVSDAILDYYEFRDQHGAEVWVADEQWRGSTTFEQWAGENASLFRAAAADGK